MKKKKDLVHVRVIRHLPQGLSVELDNGERGMIRAREISWNRNSNMRWKEDYPVGWDGYAFSIPARRDEAPEFSLRLVESDPWDDFSEGFDKSVIFDGMVTGVYEYGVFIEIEPGISGLLHKSHIPMELQSSILDLFWHGDKVFVTVREIDDAERQIDLRLASLAYIPFEESNSLVASMPLKDVERVLDLQLPRSHILVVEDEDSQAQVVSGWLHDLGQSVDIVRNAEDALAFLEKTQPDIALVDIGLPGMNGMELARRILENYPQVQVVNATDWAHASQIKATLDDLQVLGGKLLYKPILLEDLEVYLLTAQDQRAGSRREEPLPLPSISKIDAKRPIHGLIVEYRKLLGAEQIFLFSLELAHRRIYIAERAGDAVINKSAISQLIHSPVRDVAEDREIVVANEISDRERKRFRYLLEFAPLIGSCMGVPVPAQTALKYALFALDRRPKQFSGERHLYAQGMALAIGAALDQKDLRERTALMQRSALIGNLTSGMMHEISNLVGPLLLGANGLRKKMVQIEKDAGKISYADLNDDVIKIHQDVRRIVNTTRAFSRITAKGRSEILRVDEIIEETLMLLRDISDGSNVSINFASSSELRVVRNQAAVLEQIILNVTLNAIQQLVEFRPGIKGWIKVGTQMVDKAGQGAYCQIYIEDNGPGIHFGLWEKVFEIGYTTRREGSGIGLYVSRNLMRDIGGEIFILKSHILSGTTFVLEFPAYL